MITGLTIIMLGGEIDLSLGYQISLGGILIGKLLTADVPVQSVFSWDWRQDAVVDF